MPFGRYQGVAYGDLPPTYIAWLRRQPWLRTEWPEVADQLGADGMR